ncbi:MAG: virulence RhuM family protein [Chlorobium sp.]|nr:MAG: virulence RhuM family protein [Chlorobium sp.]
MGLTSWEGAPQGKIHKYDVSIAKIPWLYRELQRMNSTLRD